MNVYEVVSDVRCTCRLCGEEKYFVEGVTGPTRWQHVRTHQAECAPLCPCGQPAVYKIGQCTVDGGQWPYFLVHHWECAACAAKTCRIEAVR